MTISPIKKIDHFVLTVASIETFCEFHQRIMGMQIIDFADNRKALKFGE